MSRLEDDKKWQLASEIAHEAYNFLNELPEDEKWDLLAKMRTKAVDLSTAVADAAGSIDPRDQHYYLGIAKRSTFGLKNLYHLAFKSGALTIEPESMVRLDKLSDLLDAEIDLSSKEIPKFLQQYDGGVKK